jgi:hypothetical protein
MKAKLFTGMIFVGMITMMGLTTADAAKRKAAREPVTEPQQEQVVVPVKPKGLDAEAINFINTHYINRETIETSRGEKDTHSVIPISLTIVANGNVELICKSTTVTKGLMNREEYKWIRTHRALLANLSTNVLVSESNLTLECRSGDCWTITDSELIISVITENGNNKREETARPNSTVSFRPASLTSFH